MPDTAPRVDFTATKRAAVNAIEALLSRWLPGGKIEAGEYIVKNPRRHDQRPGSFKINMGTGKWSDFAVDGAEGGDPISLLAYLDGINQVEAARRVAAELRVEGVTSEKKTKPATKTPIIPVPADAPPMQFKHPKYGEPSRAWPYHNTAGALVCYAARFDFVGDDGKPDKDVLPLTFCDLGNGKRGWRSKGVPEPRPLYKLPEILARVDAPVIVAEGEKSADAAARLFPDAVATTPMHGAKSPRKTDWAPLARRKVIIATDNDEAGQKFGDLVAELVCEAGAAEVLHLSPDRLAGGAELPKGWDIADAEAEGWTAERIAKAAENPSFLPPYHSAEPSRGEEAASYEWPFRLTPQGVEKRIERTDNETGITSIEWRWFCSPLEVTAETRNSSGEEWGRLLSVTDRDKRVKSWAMPMSMLAGDGTAYRERLLSLGLIMSPGRFARDALHEYIATARPKEKARCVDRIGWHGAYILPDATFGATAGERVILQTVGTVDHAFRVAGTLASWQQNVAQYAAGNSRLAFAISAAFAAPLVGPTATESGGFHLRGASSTGKSTALVVAGSAWGGGGVKGYVRQWRATDNGLETVSQQHCDALLCLDELSQIAPTAAGAAAYMLANGAGKSRAGRSGEGRAAAEWRILFLSTGEISIADKLAEDGKGRRAAAGQQVRVVDIPADAGAGLGLFEHLHGFASADAFARHLKSAAGEHYGTPARAFLELLTKDVAGAAETVAKYRAEFLKENCADGADGQVTRVATRFALVAAAGEMATSFGVLPWQPGEATNAAATCFSAWLDSRGGDEPAEEREGIAAVRKFIELHGTSRFEPMGTLIPLTATGEPIEPRVNNRAGFRCADPNGGIEYRILPEVWRAEVCAGMDASAVARALLRKGLLIPGKEGEKTMLLDRARLPGFSNPVRHYHLTAAILGDA